MMVDEEPRLAGTVFLNNVYGFEQIVGRDAVQRAVARLPPDARAEFEATVPVAWIRCSTVDRLYELIAAEAGQDLQTLYPRVVRAGMTRTLRTVWRVMLRLTTDKALVARAPQLFAKGHDRGRLTARIDRPGMAELELTQWPNVPDLRMRGVAYAVAAVLEHAGRRNVEIDFERTPDGASYVARWQT